jgi:signal transduction histidine kinase
MPLLESATLAAVVFVVIPLAALSVALVTSGVYVRRLGDRRLLFLVVVLGIMAAHQGMELADFLLRGVVPAHTEGEALETLVNLLAAGSINYAVWYLHEERLLRRNLAALNRFLRHDLRNDLTLIRGHVENTDPESDAGQASLESALAGIDAFVRKAERTRHLEAFIEDPDAQSPSDLATTLSFAVDRIRERFPEATVAYDPPDGVTVVGTRILGYVFETIIENAVVHNDSAEPHVWIDVTEGDTEVTVSIADDASGIDDDKKRLLLDADERDPLAHGEGLGLFFVQAAVRTWGGEVRISDREPSGTVVAVALPKPGSLNRIRNAIRR